jgi:hypothetical protein
VNNINDESDVANDNSGTDKLLAARVATLPEEITPERDLWAGIEHAINAKQQQPESQEQVNTHSNNVYKVTFTPVAWAASIVLAVLISWGTMTPLLQKSPVDQLAQNPLINEDLVNYMEQNFSKQKHTMLVSFGQPNLANLSVEMQNELTKLADARKAISKALLSDNTNVDLLNLLDFTQQQELKLLEQLYRQYQVI